jgi:NADH:ubiquinone oxidoreductase subunit 5 (subunit L)/multisubunit Na+/H+ antiporter MnhA subunit
LSPFATAVLAIVAPFIAAPLAFLLGRRGNALLAALPVLIASAVGVGALTQLLPLVREGNFVPVAETSAAWIPAYNLAFSLNIDGFGVFFALVVLGLGFLITLYGSGYMAHEEGVGKFFAYFALFMGSMTGVVLADDLLLLGVFWELTSITSFLLIGFKHEKEESRNGALRALLITFIGGLCLMAAAVLARIEGYSSLSSLIRDPQGFLATASATPVMILLLLGAFTKSAQFPFHIWLPGAMAAPTPVSAYLHSATMVKAGVYLAGRIYPIFESHALWFPILTTVGSTTMVVAAWLAISARDLKAILAYSTISQLGLLFAVYGVSAMPGGEGLHLDLYHITSHAFYKAALFMLAGIVDHETGTRDTSVLRGLFRSMPKTGVVLLTAAACLASIPPTTGFISKEVFLKLILELMHTHTAAGAALLLGIAFAATATVFFALRLSVGILFGPTAELPKHPHDPPMSMLLPPAILAVATVALGASTNVWAGWLHMLEMPGVMQSAEPHDIHLIPHDAIGAQAFGVSVGAIILGAIAFRIRDAIIGRAGRLAERIPLTKMFDAGTNNIMPAGRWVSRLHYSGRLGPALIVALLFAVGVGTLVAARGLGMGPLRAGLIGGFPVGASFVALVMIVAAVSVPFLRNRLAMIVTMSVTGYGVSVFWVFFRAPDLALTQLLIETISLFLLLAAFRYLPAFRRENDPPPTFPSLRLALAVGTGLFVTYLVLAMGTAPPHRSDWLHAIGAHCRRSRWKQCREYDHCGLPWFRYIR